MHILTQLVFEKVPITHYPLVKSFYKSARYFNQVGKKDEVYVLRDKSQSNTIVAAVRLVKTADYLILRSMVVHPNIQRKGIGLFFLDQLTKVLQDRSCWCFPFEWLENFYASIGFETRPAEESPTIIKDKYHQYTRQGRKILIMHHPH